VAALDPRAVLPGLSRVSSPDRPHPGRSSGRGRGSALAGRVRG